MEITLLRTYYNQGTNGILLLNKEPVCYTIELPWLHNVPTYSCIPEGVYTIGQRISRKFGTHLLVKNVPGRNMILLHPANDAIRELQGCIAPVTKLTGIGKGLYSRQAMRKLMDMLSAGLHNETIFLTINKKSDDLKTKIKKSNSPFL